MDRKTWIAVILCSLALFGWQWYYGRKYNEEMARYREAVEAAKAAQPPVVAAASPIPPAAPAAPTVPGPTSPAPGGPVLAPGVAPVAQTTPEAPERRELLSTGVAEYTFTTSGGGISEVALSRHVLEGGPVRLNAGRWSPIGAVSFIQGRPDNGAYEYEAQPGTAVLTRVFPDGLKITKNFRVSGEGSGDYVVPFDLIFENVGPEAVERPFYNVHLGAAAPVHPRDLPTYTGLNWRRADNGSKFIDANWFNEGRLLGFSTRAARPLYEQEVTGLRWAGVKNQYFTTIFTLPEPADARVLAWPFEVKFAGESRPQNALEASLNFPGFRIAPGEKVERRFSLYSGPKEHGQLSALGAEQDEVLNYGMFKPFSIALLWAMNTLNRWLGNYALAIIVLTLVIKSALYPLQSKANNSMRKMAALSPKMTELRTKYQDDPTRMNQEVMKLYKDYGVNPFGGCLPMMVQIPIFFGFYSMLGTAVELRNSKFLWVNDLSQPDTVFHLASFPVNILPLVMAGTMLWQMSLTPKTGDAVQQRIFMFMPLIFIAFCYNFASALALYWTVQNLFSVVQLYLTRNQPIPALTKIAPPADLKGRKGGKGRR